MYLFKLENTKTGQTDIVIGFSVNDFSGLLWNKITRLRRI